MIEDEVKNLTEKELEKFLKIYSIILKKLDTIIEKDVCGMDLGHDNPVSNYLYVTLQDCYDLVRRGTKDLKDEFYIYRESREK